MLGRFVFVVCAATDTSSGVSMPSLSRQAEGFSRNKVWKSSFDQQRASILPSITGSRFVTSFTSASDSPSMFSAVQDNIEICFFYDISVDCTRRAFDGLLFSFVLRRVIKYCQTTTSHLCTTVKTMRWIRLL